MLKFNKSQLFTLGSIVVTLISMSLSNKAQEEELKEIKEQIKLELKEEKEN